MQYSFSLAMAPTPFEILATVLFTLAVLHTFLIKNFHHRVAFFLAGLVFWAGRRSGGWNL